MSDYTYTDADWRENAKYGLVGVTADDATEHWDRWLREHDAKVRAEERERCAQIAESVSRFEPDGYGGARYLSAKEAQEHIVRALRAQGEETDQ